MIEIVRGDGMKYALAYNQFHNLESICVAGKAENLVTYTYKNSTGRLKAITYANGHVVSANAFDITLDGEMVTKRDLTHTIRYHYNKDGALTGKQVNTNGNVVNTRYTTPEEGQPEVTVTMGDTAFTSRSKTDHLGRKKFEEPQIGGEFLSRRFNYHMDEVTDTHKNANKVKSTPTTQLVSQIVLSDGRAISYEYDEEERITKADDSVDGVTTYTYDALGQLVEEKHKAMDAESYTIVNAMTYDRYGNIKTKNDVQYVYGDKDWKDLLTSYNDQSITCDAQGNPISYLGHTLAWEKGRQLKSFDGIEYTYNANGIRTSKTVAGDKHEFVLDGTKILRETWDGNTLTPLYDNEDSVCGILYNNEPYYFLKNLQGDVIAIVDKNAQIVARYTYDAWGKVLSVKDASGTIIDANDHIATINPFRYRCYYYDTETGLYYVSSRYYDPEIGRFVNGDEVENTLYTNIVLDYNIFTYVQNNPVVLSDSTGESWITDLWEKAKKGVSSAWNWLKKACSNVGNYFKNTVWKKWIVTGVWNTFCKKWVWEKFCKEMVYNTFIKKWVWQTFCKKWTWQTFCKKWVWQTFCKKWVWETFCKDWIANKAWNWLKGNWKRVVDGISIFGGSASWVIDVLAACGIVSVAPPLAVALLIFGGICLVWDVLRCFGVF